MVEGCVDKFQLIFVDQYMASVEKQLLGTETVRALRAAGCKARICGLSANDVQQAFEDAGANAFMIKPFPTKADALKKDLLRILDGYDIDSKDRLKPVEGVVPIVRKEEGSEHEMPVDIKANKCIQAGTVKTALAQDVFSSGKHNPAATE